MKSEKENVIRRCLNMVSDGGEVMCGGRLFQKLVTETGKARRWRKIKRRYYKLAEGMARDGTSVTWVKYDDRYAGALSSTVR